MALPVAVAVVAVVAAGKPPLIVIFSLTKHLTALHNGCVPIYRVIPYGHFCEVSDLWSIINTHFEVIF